MDEESFYLNAIARGDEEAFTKVFLLYFSKVKRFISSLLQNDFAAEDLSQNIFIRLWQNREKLTEINNLNAYLFKSARNEVFQYIRHELVIREYQETHYERMLKDENSICFAPEDNFEAEELSLLIKLAVDRMPEQRKKIYKMSREEGRSNDDISEELNINKRTVENHLTQALADIREVVRHFSLIFFLF